MALFCAWGLAFSCSAWAQDGNATAPKYEFSGAYSYLRGNAGNFGASFNTNGVSGSAAYNFNPRLGVVGDVGFYKFGGLPSGLTSSMYTFLAGPRLSFRKYERVQPFAHVLFGFGHLTASRDSVGVHAAENGFALVPGAGIDLFVKESLAVRAFQFDFVRTNFDRSNGLGTTQNNWRISAGVVFRRGSYVPRRYPSKPSGPPTVSCSAEPSSVVIGSGTTSSSAWVQASASDGGALSYEWIATAGKVEGTGASVRWNFENVPLGIYTIAVRVSDTHGAVSRCSSNLEVVPRPNRPPVVACSVDSVNIESGRVAHIVAKTADPDNDPLTITWQSSAGNLSDNGGSADLDTTNLSAGVYSVSGHVADGHGGSADCSVELSVTAAPVVLTPLEQRLALHSIYFPTDLPSQQQPMAGLLGSQQRTLQSISSDFKKYLESKPNARLILQGHADERGAVTYNQKLSERRVQRVRDYLVLEGVPFNRIEILAYGYSRNLTATQVKQLVEANSDLSDIDRASMLEHMRTVVLANNRRVDIMLSTVLQQSEKKYPFKVEDALALIRESRQREPVRGKHVSAAKP